MNKEQWKRFSEFDVEYIELTNAIAAQELDEARKRYAAWLIARDECSKTTLEAAADGDLLLLAELDACVAAAFSSMDGDFDDLVAGRLEYGRVRKSLELRRPKGIVERLADAGRLSIGPTGISGGVDIKKLILGFGRRK